MGFDVLSYAIGLQAGKASSGSSEKILFKEQEVNGFAYDESFDTYANLISPVPFALIAGETYFVKWDKNVYECVAQDVSAMLPGTVAIGNISAFTGGAGNNEPFVIGSMGEKLIFLALDAQTSHTIGIYRGGETGGSFRYFNGSFTATATQETITHSIGEVPDIILVVPNKAPTNNTMIYTMGFSQAMIDKTNGNARNYAAVLTSQGSFRMYASEGIENDFADVPYGQYGGIRKFTDSTFTIGSSNGKLAVGNAYDYYAVSGIV